MSCYAAHSIIFFEDIAMSRRPDTPAPKFLPEGAAFSDLPDSSATPANAFSPVSAAPRARAATAATGSNWTESHASRLVGAAPSPAASVAPAQEVNKKYRDDLNCSEQEAAVSAYYKGRREVHLAADQKKATITDMSQHDARRINRMLVITAFLLAGGQLKKMSNLSETQSRVMLDNLFSVGGSGGRSIAVLLDDIDLLLPGELKIKLIVNGKVVMDNGKAVMVDPRESVRAQLGALSLFNPGLNIPARRVNGRRVGAVQSYCFLPPLKADYDKKLIAPSSASQSSAPIQP